MFQLPHDDSIRHGIQDIPSINFTSTSLPLEAQTSGSKSHPSHPVSKESDNSRAAPQLILRPDENGRAQTGKRIFRPNPLLQKPEDARDRRRNLFIKKVQNSREEKIMEARGGEDEMMRLIFLSEQNRWETNQERAARTVSSWSFPSNEIQESHQVIDAQAHQLKVVLDSDMAMADAMADIEERELQEIVKHLDSEQEETHDSFTTQPHQAPEFCPSCGSDEIFQGYSESLCFNCGRNCDN
ncbi:hypothetical protein TWF694_002764 [Orbilia ellipsospora]|uniref:Uncharacterized protein n=1 Tax=Orbilia ellipsospora TaxID=2528407 RepID=A0AAV9X0R9_9PEZI